MRHWACIIIIAEIIIIIQKQENVMVSKKFVLLGCLVTSVLMGSDYQAPANQNWSVQDLDQTPLNQTWRVSDLSPEGSDSDEADSDTMPANQSWRMEDFGD